MTLPVLPFTSLYNSALRAIELGDFKKIIAENLDDAGKLDKKALVRLAIALDGVGRRDDAYDVLANWNRLDSDALGTMAGRLKRKWLFSGRDRADAEGAMAHYGKAYELARAGEKSPQIYYHGINLAFLALVYEGDKVPARVRAKEVLEVCNQAEREGSADEWLNATRGEAQLILGDLVLRHQLNVLRRKSPDRLAFSSIDRVVFAGMYTLAPNILDALKIVQRQSRGRAFRAVGQARGDGKARRKLMGQLPQSPKQPAALTAYRHFVGAGNDPWKVSIVRSAPRPAATLALRAAGVALPPTIRDAAVS